MSLGFSVTPIKLGVKFEPPSILLYYRDKGKLRSRLIPCRDVDILTDITLYVEKFKSKPKNKSYFDKIANKRIEKVIFILQDNMKGYTLKESLVRAKKYDDSKEEDKIKDNDDDDDFHDTDDESEFQAPSVSTIEDNLKAKKAGTSMTVNLMDALKTTLTSPFKKDDLLGNFTSTIKESPISKSSALDLLSTQMKSVKNSIYDFEDDAEQDIDEEINEESDEDDDDSVKKSARSKKKKDGGFEVAPKDDMSDSSF